MEAVIVVDVINEFVYGNISSKRARRILEPLRNFLDKAREHKIPIIYVSDSHLPLDPEIKVWGKHAMKGTGSAKIVEEVEPREGDYILEKRTYSGFYETGLDLLLRGLKVDTLIITGLYLEICVKHTVADAFFRNYRIIIPKDCVESFEDSSYEKELEYLKMIYGAKIVSSNNIIASWAKLNS